MNKSIAVVRMPEVTDLAGEKVMVDFETGKYLLLKGVANDIWDLLGDSTSSDEIVAKLLTEYEVEEDVCRNEVLGFLDKLADFGFVKLENC